MGHYLRVFNFLWRAKRMEYTLTDIWKGQMCNAKLLKTMPGMLHTHTHTHTILLKYSLHLVLKANAY